MSIEKHEKKQNDKLISEFDVFLVFLMQQSADIATVSSAGNHFDCYALVFCVSITFFPEDVISTKYSSIFSTNIYKS